MKKITFLYFLTFLSTSFFLLAGWVGSANANETEDLNDHRHLQPVMTAIDYHTRMIYIINTRSDKVITIDPLNISDWPGDVPLQHTLVLPNGKDLYITTDNTEQHGAYIIALKVDDFQWDAGTARVKVAGVLPVDRPMTPAELPFVEPVNGNQAVPNWLLAQATQVHGPTILPHSNFIYFTEWTSDRVRVIDRKTNQFAAVDPITIPGYTEQTHGIAFNKSGTIGLGTGYFFDNNVIDRYKVNSRTGELSPVDKIMLGNEKRYAAFSHFVFWLDERYALTATMQFDKTSLTPSETEEIIPPSVWLIDAWEGTTVKIIDHTDNVNGHGIFRSASDLTVIGDKLYIAEEDSMDYTFGEDGYVSVFDISNRFHPQFIKRLKPGNELPNGFAVAHTLSPSPDNRFLMLSSWASGYMLKIDTMTDTVVKVFGPAEGMVMPHGLHSAGSIR